MLISVLVTLEETLNGGHSSHPRKMLISVLVTLEKTLKGRQSSHPRILAQTGICSSDFPKCITTYAINISISNVADLDVLLSFCRLDPSHVSFCTQIQIIGVYI